MRNKKKKDATALFVSYLDSKNSKRMVAVFNFEKYVVSKKRDVASF